MQKSHVSNRDNKAEEKFSSSFPETI